MTYLPRISHFAGAVLMLLSVQAFAQAEEPINPFKKRIAAVAKPTTAGTKGDVPPPLLPLADTTASAPAPQLVLPPSIPGQLPPLLGPGQAAQANGLSGTAQKPSGSDEPPKPIDKSSPFMSREVIEAQRTLCNSSLQGPTIRPIPYQESELSLKFKKVAGQNCLVAVAVDDAWVDAQLDVAGDEVRLIAEENGTLLARSTWVSVVAGTQSFKIKVRQEASSKKLPVPVDPIVVVPTSPRTSIEGAALAPAASPEMPGAAPLKQDKGPTTVQP
jgi:hypothetical protein